MDNWLVALALVAQLAPVTLTCHPPLEQPSLCEAQNAPLPDTPKDTGRLARYLALIGSNLFDAGTTHVALQRPGTREAGPMGNLAKNPVALFSLKAGMGLAQALLLDRLKNRKAANITAGTIAGANTAIGISNLQKGQ